MSSQVQLHGFIGSSLIGIDPFSPRSWSGISRFFLTECQRQGMLHGADGGEVSGLRRLCLLGMSLHPNKEVWRLRYYLSPKYRAALTRIMQPKLSRVPGNVDVIQFGAMFDIPSVNQESRRCFSYHDGNMAMRINNPFASVSIPPRLAAAAMSYEKSVYDKLDRIFTMSEYLRQSFIRDFLIPPEKVVCIGAGVNLEHLPAELPGKSYDNREILFIGSDFERKGGKILLQAFSILRRRHPDAKLHIVGPRTAPPSSLPMDGVLWHGHLRKQDPAEARLLTELLHRASLFTLPSLYEPFGIAPAEALIHGLPAVVTGEWALAETVAHGVTGLHVARASVDSLAEALDRILSSPDLAKSMGAAGFESAKTRFTWPAVISHLCREITVGGR